MTERNIYTPGYTQKLLNKAKGYGTLPTIAATAIGAEVFLNSEISDNTETNIISYGSDILRLQNNIDSIFGKGKYVVRKIEDAFGTNLEILDKTEKHIIKSC